MFNKILPIYTNFIHMYVHKNVTFFFTNISQTNVQSILKAEQR